MDIPAGGAQPTGVVVGVGTFIFPQRARFCYSILPSSPFGEASIFLLELGGLLIYDRMISYVVVILVL